MALINYTVAEVRTMLDTALPYHQAAYDKQKDAYEAKLAKWKERYEELKNEAETKKERREELLEEKIQKVLSAQEEWRKAHPIRKYFQREKTYDEVRNHVALTVDLYDGFMYGYSQMWLYRPRCPANESLTFCENLAKQIAEHEPERMVGLRQDELEILLKSEG